MAKRIKGQFTDLSSQFSVPLGGESGAPTQPDRRDAHHHTNFRINLPIRTIR